MPKKDKTTRHKFAQIYQIATNYPIILDDVFTLYEITQNMDLTDNLAELTNWGLSVTDLVHIAKYPKHQSSKYWYKLAFQMKEPELTSKLTVVLLKLGLSQDEIGELTKGENSDYF